MEYVRLGNTGMQVSRICLGCMSFGKRDVEWPWQLNEEESRPLIKQAIDLGINFFDTADIYSYGTSEEILGRVLHDLVPRDEVVIATKVFNEMSADPNDRGLSRKHILTSIDRSLKRLQTDYVDLYQIHRWDHNTPIEETLEALNDVVRSGKVRYIGASAMFAWQFAKALFTSDLHHGWARFVSMQNQYNLVYREEEREMIPLCEDQKIGLIPYSPLAKGILARKPQESDMSLRQKVDTWSWNYYDPASTQVAQVVSEVADDRGVPMAQVALAWMLAKPVVSSAIIGATKPRHLEEASAAVEIKLSPEELQRLDATYIRHPILGFS